MTQNLLAVALYRKELAELLSTLKGIRTVREHAGTFTEDDVKQIMMNAPALHVAILAIRPAEGEPSGNVQCALKLAIYIVTKDEPGLPRDTAAINIATALIMLLDRRQMKVTGKFLGQPLKNFAWRSLYTSGGQSTGVLLSALDCDCNLTILRDLTEPELMARFESFYLGDELALASTI